MTRVKLAAHLNDIIRRHRNGESAASLARDFGVSTTTVTTALERVGVRRKPIRGEPITLTSDVRDKVLNLFAEGMQPIAIAEAMGHSKSTVYQILKHGKAKLRGHVDSFVSPESVAAISRTVEANAEIHVWPAEEKVAEMLTERGFDPVHQMSIEIGNVDLAIPSCSVAVEVCARGCYSKYMASGWFERRIRELGKRGWHSYFILARDAETITLDGVDDLCLWADFLRRQPTARRQYRVVWRAADLLATGCSDQQDIAVVMPSEYARYVANRSDAG